MPSTECPAPKQRRRLLLTFASSPVHCVAAQLLGYFGEAGVRPMPVPPPATPVPPPAAPAAKAVTRSKAAVASSQANGSDQLKAVHLLLLKIKDARVADVPGLLEQALSMCV